MIRRGGRGVQQYSPATDDAHITDSIVLKFNQITDDANMRKLFPLPRPPPRLELDDFEMSENLRISLFCERSRWNVCWMNMIRLGGCLLVARILSWCHCRLDVFGIQCSIFSCSDPHSVSSDNSHADAWNIWHQFSYQTLNLSSEDSGSVRWRFTLQRERKKFWQLEGVGVGSMFGHGCWTYSELLRRLRRPSRCCCWLEVFILQRQEEED